MLRLLQQRPDNCFCASARLLAGNRHKQHDAAEYAELRRIKAHGLISIRCPASSILQRPIFLGWQPMQVQAKAAMRTTIRQRVMSASERALVISAALFHWRRRHAGGNTCLPTIKMTSVTAAHRKHGGGTPLHRQEERRYSPQRIGLFGISRR